VRRTKQLAGAFLWLVAAALLALGVLASLALVEHGSSLRAGPVLHHVEIITERYDDRLGDRVVTRHTCWTLLKPAERPIELELQRAERLIAVRVHLGPGEAGERESCARIEIYGDGWISERRRCLDASGVRKIEMGLEPLVARDPMLLYAEVHGTTAILGNSVFSDSGAVAASCVLSWR
jgi:hypothetical protein